MPPTKDTSLKTNADYAWDQMRKATKTVIPKHLGNARHSILKIRALRRAL